LVGIGVWVGMINLTFVRRSPKGAVRRCRHEWPILFALAFDNESTIVKPLSND